MSRNSIHLEARHRLLPNPDLHAVNASRHCKLDQLLAEYRSESGPSVAGIVDSAHHDNAKHWHQPLDATRVVYQGR